MGLRSAPGLEGSLECACLVNAQGLLSCVARRKAFSQALASDPQAAGNRILLSLLCELPDIYPRVVSTNLAFHTFPASQA